MSTPETPRPVREATPATVGWTPANPAPLGLAAFAMTTFVLSVFNAKLVSRGAEPVVLPLALFYGGIVQVLAGLWEFRTGNTFGALAFCSYGAFWLGIWGINHLYAAEIIRSGAENLAHGVGLYLWAWAIFTAYMLVASFRVSAAIVVVFALLLAAFIFLAAGNSGLSENTIKVGGWLGIATAAAAWYASMAEVVNSTFGRHLLPVRSFRPTTYKLDQQ